MRRIIPFIIVVLTITAACSSIDCPFNNTVYSSYVLRSADGITPDTLTDTLTVYTVRQDGQDTVLLNKSVKTDSFSLPMSYVRDADMLIFALTDTLLKQTLRDTVRVTKTNYPHFESVDCAMSYFHTITDVSSTHHTIDTIIITNSSVTYDASKAHFHIRFKSGH